MTPRSGGRGALLVWLQLAGLLAAVAAFGGIVFLLTRGLRAGG